MTRQLLILGKGGVGKTTLAAALSRALHAAGERVLLIDADADGTLGLVLDAPARPTVAELKETLKESRTRTVPDLAPLLAPLAPGWDLLRLGRSEAAGCYCAPNNRLRAGLGPLTARYTWVIADSHAGSELVSRGVLTPDLVALLQRGQRGDPSQHVAQGLAAAIAAHAPQARTIPIVIGGPRRAWPHAVHLPRTRPAAALPAAVLPHLLNALMA